VIKECERELQIPVDVDFVNGDDQKISAAPQKNSPAPVPATAKPSRMKQTSIIAAIVMLLIFGIYFFVSQKSGNSPRWSMEEIAPQKYKGSSPPNTEVGKATEIKTVTPVEKMPVDDNAAQNQVQETASVNKIQPDHVAVPKKVAVPFPYKGKKVLIYFKHNSNELPDPSFEALTKIADYMLHNLDDSINIKGFTDSTGSYSYNVSVSEFRANTIKTYLVGKGIEFARIKTFGLGPENPIASNKTEAGRRQNRRVEIELEKGLRN
jgi:outer membrane protein OmpA-like peptidoglycan-associated protein